jgi:hypothetical protein
MEMDPSPATDEEMNCAAAGMHILGAATEKSTVGFFINSYCCCFRAGICTINNR